MNTNTYILIPRGPVRGIGDTIIYDECEIELNDFQALKVLLQGHQLKKEDEVVTIKDFVEDVDPQCITDGVNLVPDVTAGSKSVNSSVCKVFGSAREYVAPTFEVEEDAEEEVTSEEEPILKGVEHVQESVSDVDYE